MEIKTAEEIFMDINGHIKTMTRCQRERVHQAMKEYANQFLDLASEEARFKEMEGEYRDDVTDTIENGYGEVYGIDKQSILKLKEKVL